MENARKIFPDIEYCQDPYEAARGSDAIIIVTDWEEFKVLDRSELKQLLKRPIIIDGRNIYDPGMMKEMGFMYQSIGR